MNETGSREGSGLYTRPRLALRELRSRDPLDPIAILEAAGSSPFGAAGMPPAETALAASEGVDSMEILYHDQFHAPLVLEARAVRRMNADLVFEGAERETVVQLRPVRSVRNLRSGVMVHYKQELELALLEDTSGPRLVRLAQLMKAGGEMLLRLSGHVKPPEYMAWEAELDEFITEQSLPLLAEPIA